MANVLSYTPLPDNQRNFRLLELLPGAVRDPLRCRLRVEKLCAAPAYDALSYAWRVFGDERDLATIECDDGRALDITANLEAALRSIRDAEQLRLVWADAICINQEDLLERKEQVQRMKTVYESASRVLVWLGANVSFTAPDLFAFLDKVAELSAAPKRYGQDQDFELLDDYLKHTEPSTWEMLRELHECSVFRRIWIVQELNLAADGYLVAGQHRLRLDNFKRSMFWIRKRRPIEPRRLNIPWENLDPFIYLRFVAGDTSRPPASITGSSSPQTVYFVLRCNRNCTSTDPRDMIYGLLGHSSLETWTRANPGRTRVPVDYEMPHLDVYFAAACRLLEDSQPLFTLSLVEHDESHWNKTVPECPSWVPRWELTRRNYILADEFRDRYEKMRSRPASHKLSGRVFEVQGCLVDRIAWRSPTLTLDNFRAGLPGFRGDRSSNMVRQVWEHLRDAVLGEHPDHARENELVKDFCLTLNAGCRTLSGQTYRGDVTVAQRISDCAAVLEVLGALPTTPTTSSTSREEDCDRFLATTQDVCRDRCLFWTGHGRMGLGPRVASVGDEVVVLFGAQVPFLLSPSASCGEAHRLCGEGYVHGLMNGEAMDALDAGTIEERMFRLV